jgi:hypothetical protein
VKVKSLSVPAVVIVFVPGDTPKETGARAVGTLK